MASQKESDEFLCTIWSLVMVRNQLPAQRPLIEVAMVFAFYVIGDFKIFGLLRISIFFFFSFLSREISRSYANARD